MARLRSAHVVTVHTLIYSDDAPATPTYLRDRLGLTTVLDVPGAGPIMQYEPRQATAFDL